MIFPFCRAPIRHLLMLPVLAAGPVALTAQTPAELAAGAEAITAADLGRHIEAIAADSMRGRDTPSPGLEATARYVAGQFQQLGLTPADDSGSWFQRYPIPSVLDLAHSRVVFATADSQVTEASFVTAVWLDRHVAPQTVHPAGVVVAAGRLTAKALHDAHLAGRVVLYVAPNRPEPEAEQQATEALRSVLERDGGEGLITLSNLDSVIFAWHLHRAQRQPEVRSAPDEKLWSAQLRLDAVPRLRTMLMAQGIDLDHIRTETTPFVRDLPLLHTSLDLHFSHTAADGATAPNVIAVIEGSDSLLRREYVLFVAHMDHTSFRQGQPDSIANSTNDNASGVAGLLALAKAFSQPGARPARSVAFVATSGAKNFWGSTAFLDQVADARGMVQFFEIPLDGDHVPIIYLTAAFNLDMIGGHTDNSVMVDGLSEVDLPTPPVWVAAAHPELDLTVVDGGTAMTDASEHFAFVQQAVPSLSFHNGSHDAAEPPTGDATSTIDAELEARILRLVYYLGENVANAKKPAQWNSQGRQHYLEMFAH